MGHGSAMVRTYIFRAHYKGAVASAASTQDVLTAFGSFAQFEALFGGSMSFGLPSAPEFLGVWGNRNATRFRRLLRERLGELTMVHSAPPSRHSLSAVHGYRPSRLERAQLEAKLPALKTPPR